MKKKISILFIGIISLGLFALGGADNTSDSKIVNFYGWGGSAQINAWIDGYLSDLAREKYGIKINRVGMNIDEVLNLMLGEKQAGKKNGSVDLVWINGENFYTAKNAKLLYKIPTSKIPNYTKYIDANSPDVKYDFGHQTDSYEVPYGKAQFVFVYDSAKIKSTPTNHKDLLEWCKKNPGKFTYAALPDFTASAFVRNIIYDIVDYKQFLTMEPDEKTVKKAIQPALDYLNELKPYLWNQGKTYPADTSTLSNLFADGEILMTMSYNPNDASLKIEQGLYTKSTRTFLFDKGTIGNTHFVAIPKNATNKEAALKLIDCILSVEAQAEKANPKVWGDIAVLDFAKLNLKEKAVFNSIPLGKATLKQSELSAKRLPEMPAGLVTIIEKLWLENVASK